MAYAAQIEKANQMLDQQFKKWIENSRTGHPAAAELLEIVESEQKIFAECGYAPWSEPMRRAAHDYLSELELAQRHLEIAFEKAAANARKQHDDEQLAVLEREEQIALAPHVVAIAEQQGEDGAGLEFRSDGIITRPGEAETDTMRSWHLLTKGRLKIEQPDPERSDNVLINECILARDGKSWTTSDANGDQQTWQFVRQ